MLHLFRPSLVDILPEVRGKYQKNVPLSKHTWFGVGGPAEVMYHPLDADDLSHFIRNKPYNLPMCIIGGGSNLLVRDGGIPGVVIKLDSPAFRKISIQDNLITCGAGVKNTELKKIMLDNKLGGLEFLCSIPGVIGGSVKTNAGCFGSEIKDVIEIAKDLLEIAAILITVKTAKPNKSQGKSHSSKVWLHIKFILVYNMMREKERNILKFITAFVLLFKKER